MDAATRILVRTRARHSQINEYLAPHPEETLQLKPGTQRPTSASFDRPVHPDRAAFYTVSEYKWTDSIAVYSAFQEPYTRSPVAVIESHAYAIAPEDVADAAHYADALLAELREIFPELRDAKVTHQEAMTQSNFTRFAPNDFGRRPEVATEIPNLFLAGDHVKLPFPAFLMEAAAASGRIAANHILAAEGVAEDPVRTVALRGQLADVFG